MCLVCRVTNPAKRKGDAAELEAARILAELTGWPVRRKLGAGRADDTGDLYGLPETTVQVKNRPADPLRSIREGLPALRAQQSNARTPFAALVVRRRGGRWIVVMEPDQFAALLREAVRPVVDELCRCGHPRSMHGRRWGWPTACSSADPADTCVEFQPAAGEGVA